MTWRSQNNEPFTLISVEKSEPPHPERPSIFKPGLMSPQPSVPSTKENDR